MTLENLAHLDENRSGLFNTAYDFLGVVPLVVQIRAQIIIPFHFFDDLLVNNDANVHHSILTDNHVFGLVYIEL